MPLSYSSHSSFQQKKNSFMWRRTLEFIIYLTRFFAFILQRINATEITIYGFYAVERMLFNIELQSTISKPFSEFGMCVRVLIFWYNKVVTEKQTQHNTTKQQWKYKRRTSNIQSKRWKFKVLLDNITGMPHRFFYNTKNVNIQTQTHTSAHTFWILLLMVYGL